MQRMESKAGGGSPASSLQRLMTGSGGIGFIAVVLLAVAAWSVGLLPQQEAARKVPTALEQTQPPDVTSSVIQRVGAPNIVQAISALMLSEADKAKIYAGVDNGTLRLGTITVSDFDTEDADWVSITGAGFRQDVRLFKKPLTITVPYIAGFPIVVTGLIDGGGGDITVAVSVGAASMPLRALKPGERVEIPTP